jgi:magnesium-transporting ATPase (P-type)
VKNIYCCIAVTLAATLCFRNNFLSKTQYPNTTLNCTVLKVSIIAIVIKYIKHTAQNFSYSLQTSKEGRMTTL